MVNKVSERVTIDVIKMNRNLLSAIFLKSWTFDAIKMFFSCYLISNSSFLSTNTLI